MAGAKIVVLCQQVTESQQVEFSNEYELRAKTTRETGCGKQIIINS